MSGGVLAAGQTVLFGCPALLRKKFSVSAFWTDCARYNCTVVNLLKPRVFVFSHRPVRYKYKKSKLNNDWFGMQLRRHTNPRPCSIFKLTHADDKKNFCRCFLLSFLKLQSSSNLQPLCNLNVVFTCHHSLFLNVSFCYRLGSHLVEHFSFILDDCANEMINR